MFIYVIKLVLFFGADVFEYLLSIISTKNIVSDAEMTLLLITA